MKRPALSLETRVLLLAIAAGLPGVVLTLFLLDDSYSAKVRWTFGSLAVVTWLACALALRQRVVRSLNLVSALLAALREEDFSLRAHLEGDDALAGVLREVNGLADTLRRQRLGAVEAGALLRTVMAEIDVAVLAFDGEARLRLANRAALRLLGAADALGKSAEELGLAGCLDGQAPRTVPGLFAGGPWELRRSDFRQGGRPHTLVVLTDLRRALREEERQAWQRLVRVLGHEINNSLAPIQSIAATLRRGVGQGGADFDEDSAGGLSVIARRSEGLSRFLSAYTRLARLPPPRLGEVEVGSWVSRVVALETRRPVVVAGGPAAVLRADGDQLDQLLINLVQNAADAAEREVVVSWTVEAGVLDLLVRDDGAGVADTANLFVPFFTTKPGGSGIGLALSRQIAEAHGGTLALVNRTDGRRGGEARVRLWDARMAKRTLASGEGG